jgi:hypothetical protein
MHGWSIPELCRYVPLFVAFTFLIRLLMSVAKAAESCASHDRSTRPRGFFLEQVKCGFKALVGHRHWVDDRSFYDRFVLGNAMVLLF